MIAFLEVQPLNQTLEKRNLICLKCYTNNRFPFASSA